MSLSGSNKGDTETLAPDGSAQEGAESKPQEGDEAEAEAVTTAPTDAPTRTRTSIPVLEILDYIRTSFDDETVLDCVPLEAAGNPSAWHAWKAHRKDIDGTDEQSSSKRDNPQARLPGDWHWDGIWTRRVQYEIEASRSDATLFGNSVRGPDEMVILLILT